MSPYFALLRYNPHHQPCYAMPCPSNTYTHKHTYTHTYTHTHTPMHFIPNLSYRPHFQPRVFLCRASSHHHCFITPPLPYHTTTTALSHTSLATVCLARTTHMYVYHAYVRVPRICTWPKPRICTWPEPRICMCTTHMYVYHAYVCVPRICMCTTQMYVYHANVRGQNHAYVRHSLLGQIHAYVRGQNHAYVCVPRICTCTTHMYVAKTTHMYATVYLARTTHMCTCSRSLLIDTHSFFSRAIFSFRCERKIETS